MLRMLTTNRATRVELRRGKIDDLAAPAVAPIMYVPALTGPVLYLVVFNESCMLIVVADTHSVPPAHSNAK